MGVKRDIILGNSNERTVAEFNVFKRTLSFKFCLKSMEGPLFFLFLAEICILFGEGFFIDITIFVLNLFGKLEFLLEVGTSAFISERGSNSLVSIHSCAYLIVYLFRLAIILIIGNYFFFVFCICVNYKYM